MRPLAWLPIATIVLGVAVGAQEGTETIDYFGYADCVALTNDHTRVVLTAHGGRLLEYSWQGENGIYLEEAQAGWIYTPGEPTVDPTGGRLDIGPEQIIPRRPELWLGEWQIEVIGPRAARMTSVEHAATGVQLVREFRLDPVTSHLQVTQIIRNIAAETKRWSHWSRTFGLGGGIVVIPLAGQSRFPNKYIMYGPGPVMNYRPEDPNIRVRGDFLEITGPPARKKLGFDSSAGWFSYLSKNDLMFVKRFPVYPERVYDEMAGLTISIWYNQEQMVELEPIGPREVIEPGGAAAFTEDWWLLPHKFPQDGEDVDLGALAKEVDELAR